MSWTGERVDLLKKWWAEGLSAGQIATRLGGVSRNSVMGKVHRLNLAGRSRAASRGQRSLKSRAPKQSKPRIKETSQTRAQPERKPLPARPIEEIAVPVGAKVPLLELNDSMCKWPSGDPKTEGFGFCGHRVFEGYSYCEYHARVAYTPVDQRVAA